MENNNNELQHWGIKGMKWGVRRFQNNDGSLTPAGKKRYNDGDGSDGSTKTKAPSLYSIRKAQRKAQENLKAAPNMVGDKRKQAKLDKYEQYKAEAERLKTERASIIAEKKKQKRLPGVIVERPEQSDWDKAPIDILRGKIHDIKKNNSSKISKGKKVIDAIIGKQGRDKKSGNI